MENLGQSVNLAKAKDAWNADLSPVKSPTPHAAKPRTIRTKKILKKIDCDLSLNDLNIFLNLIYSI